MKKKKWLLIPGSVAALAVLASTAFANSPIKLMIDGKLQNVSTPPSIVNNCVLVPVRDVAEGLGAKVTWDGQSNTVSIQSASTGNMKIQLEQLERAVAPQSPQDAVEKWAKGIQTRNGALQYAVMSPDLQAKNFDAFAQMNWVTGVSSPWIQDYKVIKSTQINDTEWQFDVQMEGMTSTGISGIDTTQVTVDQLNNNWFVSKLQGVSSENALLKQSANLPDGTAVGEVPTAYDTLNMVMLRVFGASASGDASSVALTPANFYGGGTVLLQETVSLPIGQATLALVQSKPNDQTQKQTTIYYVTITRDYPNRDDRKLVYTLMSSFTGDQSTAKQDLLKIAQTWKLPQQ